MQSFTTRCKVSHKKKTARRRFSFESGAQERTRTSTVLPPPGPEPGASTNSATWARFKLDGYCSGMVQRVNWNMQIDLQLTAIRFAALIWHLDSILHNPMQGLTQKENRPKAVFF